MRRALLPTLAVVTALVLSACGSGGSSASDASGSSDAAPGKVLKVASEGTYAPFTFHDPQDGNKLTGFDVEVARAVGEQMGREVEFTDVPFDSIFAGLQAGRYDAVVNEVTITPEREELYDFSTPYSVSTGVIVTRADNTDITSLADLAGKTSAQSITSSFATVAEDAGADVESVEGFTQAAALLNQGRVDATVNDRLAVLDYLETTGDDGLKIAATTDERTEQGIALDKGSDLTPEVDAALAALAADGTLAKISEKYFGTDVTR